MQDLFLSEHAHLPAAKPLAGRTVLVTRADTQSATFTTLLKAQGARVLEMPTLVITPPSDWHDLDQAISELGRFDWLILTSANAVSYFFNRLATHRLDSRALCAVKLAVVGSKTAAVLSEHGLIPDLVPDSFVADGILAALPHPKGQRILFPRVESGGREAMANGLRGAGAEVVEVAAYQSACPPQADPRVLDQIRANQIDILTFASSKTVQHFCTLLRRETLDPVVATQGMQIAAIGPKTAETCVTELGRVDVCPDRYTLEDLVDALVGHVRRLSAPR